MCVGRYACRVSLTEPAYFRAAAASRRPDGDVRFPRKVSCCRRGTRACDSNWPLRKRLPEEALGDLGYAERRVPEHLSEVARLRCEHPASDQWKQHRKRPSLGIRHFLVGDLAPQ